ncbi:MAG: helix-turn-helix transcriptional regulator, partial [Lacisediminihabitans sp.]
MSSLTPREKSEHSATEPQWTPRQREVLGLLARGCTNGQIAEQLGITLDGAKWHVSEIITKLGVDSREEAAAYGRSYNGMRRHLTRAFRSLLPGVAPLKFGAAGAAIAAAAIAGVIVVVALQSSGTPQDAARTQ